MKCTNARLLSMAMLLFVVGMLPQIGRADDIDIRGINFKPSRPLDGDFLQVAVAEPAVDSIAILQQAADTLNYYPKLRVKIVGYTDDRECFGNNCIQLSLRRAKYVLDWFIHHGVAIQQLDGPEGQGSIGPVADNAMEPGRARNRRVELQVVSY